MKTSTRVHSIARALRVLAVFIAINGVSVLLPWAWVDSVLVWCGLGHPPDAVVLHYLLRGAGFLLLAFGSLIWVVASDVVRYQPVVITIITIFLIGAPVSYLIDATVGLPSWWCILDFTICLLAGGIPLALYLWPSSSDPVA